MLSVSGGKRKSAPTGLCFRRPSRSWLTEIGIPAVDKGTNGPNVFPRSRNPPNRPFPPFSSRKRDDLIQAAGLEALIRRFDPAHSPIMIPPIIRSRRSMGGAWSIPAAMSVWAWDCASVSRPFPNSVSVWADGDNYENGSLGNGPIRGPDPGAPRAYRSRGSRRVLADGRRHGRFSGGLRGGSSNVDPGRAWNPCSPCFGVDLAVSGGKLIWRGRGGRVSSVPGS